MVCIKISFQMLPLGCRLLIHSLLLLAWADCQQADVGEVEAGKGSSSLAEFVDNLIDQMNDVKVKILGISIFGISTHTYRTTLLNLWISCLII